VSEDRQRLHAIVHGRVQGVNFRNFAYQSAIACGVLGWVRNLHDGTVETVAEGTESALQAFLDALHVGSPYSSVTHVEAEWANSEDSFTDFSIRYA
jgi:acylphosphatase